MPESGQIGVFGKGRDRTLSSVFMRSPNESQDDERDGLSPQLSGAAWGDCAPAASPETDPDSNRRLLFLDDDPVRAETFLIENPEAVWVQTVGTSPSVIWAASRPGVSGVWQSPVPISASASASGGPQVTIDPGPLGEDPKG